MSECPSSQDLERFALGRMPQQQIEAVEAHLLACAVCAVTAQSLEVNTSWAHALRAAAPSPVQTPDLDMVHTIIEQVKQLGAWRGGDSSATKSLAGAGATSPANSSPGFDFLQAPEAAGELGRLGQFRVVEVLGEGGMGVVFRAEDTRLKRWVALKVMKPHLAARSNARQRFLREAQAAAAVSHDHIMAILHVDEDRGVPYLAMPLLEGEPLNERLKRDKKLPLAQVLQIGRELAEGIAAAHASGLVHRDIKPSNIWLEGRKDEEGRMKDEKGQSDSSFILPPSSFRVKLLDFGLARAAVDTDEFASDEIETSGTSLVAMQLTQEGAIVGTPAYMAPEQAQALPVDPRCDLFSLGCVLYQMSTGQLPFQGDDSLSTLLAVVNVTPKSPLEIDPEVPRDLSNLILRLLEKQPENRPASAREVADALAQMQRHYERRPWWRRPAVWVSVVAALLLGLALLPVLFRPAPVPAPPRQGDLLLHSADPALQLRLLRGGKEAALWQAGMPPLPLDAGDYDLELAQGPDTLRVSPNRVTIEAGKSSELNIQVFGQLRRYDGSAGPIWSVALLADGKALSACGDRSASLWDLNTGVELHVLKGHKSPVQCVAASGAGRLVVTGSGGKEAKPDFSLRLWEAATGKPAGVLAGHQGVVTGAAFFQDGVRLVSCSRDGNLLLWDTGTQQAVRKVGEHPTGINGLALSPDEQQILTAGSDNVLRLWDVATGRELAVLAGHGDPVRSVAFSPDGQRAVSGSWDGTVRVWDLNAGKELQRFEGHEGWVNAVAMAPDGQRVLSAGADKTVRLWDLVAGMEICRLEGHSAAVQSVVFTADGRQALSGSLDKTLRLWQLP